jgi:hypothetical protein
MSGDEAAAFLLDAEDGPSGARRTLLQTVRLRLRSLGLQPDRPNP